MRTAPAVTVDVAPDPVWRTALLLLTALVAVALPIWGMARLLAESEPHLWTALGAVTLISIGLAVLRATWRLRQPPGRALCWTGRTWQVLDERHRATPATLTVAIDTGGWMLVQLRPTVVASERPAHPAMCLARIVTDTIRGSTWIALSERALPQAWHALRCAVHGPPVEPEAIAEPGARA